jgi:hypothetical protein
MLLEGVLRDDVLKDGEYVTVELYGMVNPRDSDQGHSRD